MPHKERKQGRQKRSSPHSADAEAVAELETEQEEISSGIKKLKKQIAPEARGTIVEGDMKSLPAQELKFLDSSDSDE